MALPSLRDYWQLKVVGEENVFSSVVSSLISHLAPVLTSPPPKQETLVKPSESHTRRSIKT